MRLLRYRLASLVLAACVVGSCSSTLPSRVTTFERYLAASNAHDLETLESMTAGDIVWRFGPWTFQGREEALRPHVADLILHTSLEARNVVARGDTIECVLVERNDATRAYGPDSLIHYPRYVFRGDVVVAKEPWAPSPSMAEFNRRAMPFRAWIRKEHPEALEVILDPDGVPSWTREAFEKTQELLERWVAAGKPGL